MNGSFESYTVNPSGCASNFSMVNNWGQFQSPDHFNYNCIQSNSYGVPSNIVGNCYPLNGNAYIGIVSYSKPNQTREYIYQHLMNPLIAGKTYFTSFFVSKGDRVKYSIKDMGMYFTIAQPTVVNISDPYIIANPQVENQSGYLTDTINWITISGYFTAQGGEQYISIGNFNSSIDTLNTGTNNPIPFDGGSAYYYIDSVSLYDSLDYVTNVKNHENHFKVNLYPNPSKGLMQLDYDLGSNLSAKINLYDVTGKLISSYNLDSNKGILQMNEQNLNNGVYFYSIYVNEKNIKTDKIVIIK